MTVCTSPCKSHPSKIVYCHVHQKLLFDLKFFLVSFVHTTNHQESVILHWNIFPPVKQTKKKWRSYSCITIQTIIASRKQLPLGEKSIFHIENLFITCTKKTLLGWKKKKKLMDDESDAMLNFLHNQLETHDKCSISAWVNQMPNSSWRRWRWR